MIVIHHRQNPLDGTQIKHLKIIQNFVFISVKFSSTSGGSSVGIVRSQTKGHGACVKLCVALTEALEGKWTSNIRPKAISAWTVPLASGRHQFLSVLSVS
jgi:hypothetical protein